MPFSANQTTRRDFPTDEDHDDSSADSRCYPMQAHNTTLPYYSGSQTVSQDMSPYFDSQNAYSGWTFSGEATGESSTGDPNAVPTDASAATEAQPSDEFWPWPTEQDSTTSAGSSTYHLNPNKITEHVLWDMPSSTEQTGYERNQELSSTIRCPPHKHNPEASTTEAKPNGKSLLVRADSARDSPHGWFESTSPPESQALPKRRYSYTGEQSNSTATPTTDPAAKPRSVDGEFEAKLLAKSSHSIVERKYRENINKKITELDQTLANTHGPNGQAGKVITDDHPHKTSKAEVLNGAVRYIKQAELESEARIKEIDFLRLRVTALEQLVNTTNSAILKQMSNKQISSANTF